MRSLSRRREHQRNRAGSTMSAIAGGRAVQLRSRRPGMLSQATPADTTDGGTAGPATGASRRDAVVEQLFAGAIGALEMLHVYVGDRLGLYTAMAELPDASPADLAGTAG